MRMLNSKYWILTFIFLLLLFRLFPIFLPAWQTKETYQIDMSRSIAHENLKFFKQNVSFIQDFKNNVFLSSPPRPWTEDFPLFNFFAAIVMKVFQTESLLTGRFLSLAFFILGTFFLYGFTKRRYSKDIALWATFFWSVSPITMNYSIYFMAESAMVSSFLGVLYFLQKYLDTNQKKFFALSIFFGMLVPAFRYYGALLWIPLLLWFLQERSWEFQKKTWLEITLLCGIPALIPAFWLGYTLIAIDNPIHAQWHWGNWTHFLLSSFEYYDRMFQRISKYSITYLGFIFLIVGTVIRRKDALLMGGIFMMLLSMGIFTEGHDINPYYQFKFIPFLSILASVGLVAGVRWGAALRLTPMLPPVLLVLLTFLAFRQTYKELRYDSSGMVLGHALKTHTNPKDRVLVVQDIPDPGAFVYGDRSGWLQDIWQFNPNEVPDFIDVIALRLSVDHLKKFEEKLSTYSLQWRIQAPLGRHQKCGMIDVFFEKCPRTEYVLAITKK